MSECHFIFATILTAFISSFHYFVFTVVVETLSSLAQIFKLSSIKIFKLTCVLFASIIAYVPWDQLMSRVWFWSVLTTKIIILSPQICYLDNGLLLCHGTYPVFHYFYLSLLSFSLKSCLKIWETGKKVVDTYLIVSSHFM